MRLAAAALLIGAILLAGSAVAAHVSQKSSAGKSLKWAAAKIPVTFVINDQGSADIPANASEDLAIRLAFRSWEDLPGSSISFKEITTPSQKARTDWEALDIHLILFDESNATGYFPPGSGVIALTPILYTTSTGQIADADILFNGTLSGGFSTNLASNTMDVQSTATHEIGHLIGLDHSGTGGATMAPFQSAQEFTPRTLTADDAAGAAALYPVGTTGRISGLVLRAAGGTPVRGANVWARSTTDGRVLTATATDSAGAYLLNGLPPDSYRVVAGPLDGPVVAGNFQSFSIGTIDVDFRTTQIGTVVVTGTDLTVAPDLLVDADATINVTGIPLVKTLHPGEGKPFTFSGAGLAGATVSVPDSAGAFVIAGTAPTFTITASGGALPGLYDFYVTDALGNVDDFNGFLEVLPAAPAISSVDPPAGSQTGGTAVTILGNNLSSPVVLFGDAQAASASPVSSGEIDAVTPAQSLGAKDVIVITGGGEEARSVGAFQFVAQADPMVASIFPSSGSTAGGTSVTISGASFLDGATVTIGGAPATGVTFVDAGHLTAVAPALAAGAHDVVVTNPGAPPLESTLSGGFTSVALADPTLTGTSVPIVASAGGDVFLLDGTGFVSGATVDLFADPSTGAGGTPAAVAFVSAAQLSVTAPPGPLGRPAIVVRNPSGQSAILLNALTYVPLMVTTGKLSGTLAAPAEVDTTIIEGVAGTKLTVTLAPAPGSTLLPKIAVQLAPGTTLISSDPLDAEFDPDFASSTSKKAAITSFVLAATGRYFVRLSALGGSTGAYKFTLKETIPASAKTAKVPAKPPTLLGPGSFDLPFTAKSGSHLSGTLTGKKPLQIDVGAFLGPGSVDLLADPAVQAGITINATGTQIKFKNVPLKLFGSYLLTIAPDNATSGVLTGSVKVAPPKSTSKGFVEPQS